MTGLTGKNERAAIRTRLVTLCGGRQYPGVPEEAELVRDANQLPKPYLIITFGQLYPSYSDRTLDDAASQPQIMPIIVECWASVPLAAEETAGEVRRLLVGYQPDPGGNASEIELRGGGWFQQRSTDIRPARFMESISAEVTINLAAD